MFHYLLKDKFYQTKLNEICLKKPEMFDRFTHFLINEINEGFNSSLSKLSEIKGKPIFVTLQNTRNPSKGGTTSQKSKRRTSSPNSTRTPVS